MNFEKKKLHVYLIGLIAFILPNIVFLKEIPQELDSIYYIAFPKGEVNLDFFSYYKMIFLIFSTAVLLVIFYLNKKNSLKWHKTYTFLLIYAFFIICSTFLSPFLPIAIRGVGDRYEGFSTLLAYLLLFYVCHSSIEDKKDIKIILVGLIASSITVGTIGIFQYFGYDFFRTDLGKALILGTKSHMKDSIQFTFGKYTIYSTLYNTNFVGSYMVLMLFLGISLFLKYSKTKNTKIIILSFLYTLFIFANLIGSRSRAGFMASQATGIFALVFFFKNFKYYLKEITVLLFSFILVFMFMDWTSKADKGLGEKLFNIKTEKNTIRNIYSKDSYLYFESIYGNLKMREENGQLNFYDLESNKLDTFISKELINKNSHQYEANIINFSNEIYSLLKFVIERDHIILVYDKKITLPIYFANKRYFSPGIDGKLFELTNIERFKLFDGRENIGSKRGYIWSRSIPLLKETLILGYGPDTYSLVFPQNDNFGKAMAFGNTNIIVDKPHNLYLQIGINTGLLALINFIIASGVFLIIGVINFNKIGRRNDFISLGLYLGVIAYLVAGLFNDSLISVAPTFWIYWALATYMLLNEKTSI